MHLPIPCSSTVEIPSFLGLSAKFSSSCSLFLLSLIGFTVLGLALALKFVFVARKSKSRDSVGESKVQKSEKVQVQVQRRTWRSFLSTWDGVNLPVTLIAPPTNTVVGRGIGINGAVLGKQMSQPVRSGPAFEQPLPAIYQSKEPVSMAKMIMSRHTFRRPSHPNQSHTPSSRRSTSLPPPSNSRPQSMV
ncbi:hypothetical protein BT96DRAFT_974132 [Gymnopus androsaceus JB14]|uniref:Uncharacterized protein n=1 Tax=Gymnopus androsaceus JB14 TaxID=1447944 RepID=A0A6A4HY97_9AGAR|nr:hypothetical protein BT96DRAFT_974132 [Gymnopus androsaceus JB14]